MSSDSRQVGEREHQTQHRDRGETGAQTQIPSRQPESLCQLAVIPDASHLSNLEQPAAFNAALLRFLARVG